MMKQITFFLFLSLVFISHAQDITLNTSPKSLTLGQRLSSHDSYFQLSDMYDLTEIPGQNIGIKIGDNTYTIKNKQLKVQNAKTLKNNELIALQQYRHIVLEEQKKREPLEPKPKSIMKKAEESRKKDKK